uniref:NADH dehydrogenase subunit 2 n=1 Tax=Megetra punctata TaxID=2493563 RepID=UPI001FA7CB84|nr:NADH dehydrogenase subunit 2 [Megetra punctata]UMR54912.1 NADH dehydrogenase subunit 2 [Megetra punctata]
MLKLSKIIFFNMMILGTLIAISSYTWLGMWMGLEINLLSVIPLMNSSKNMFSSEASLKYFITQAFASLILLLSINLMLITNEFITPMMNSSLVMVLNSALLTKLGAAPFHFWFPEVLEGLNWPVCSILLTWQKIAPMVLLINNPLHIKFLFMIILASLTISTIMSMNQVSLRKIIAFSSINHIAWLISSLLCSTSIWFIYLIIYFSITLNITMIFNAKKIFFINQISAFFNQNKNLKFSLMINFLSLGGLPPFLGFLPKWLTINWMALHNYHVIAVILIVMTLVMLFIYIRIIMTSLILSYNEPKFFIAKTSQFLNFMFNFLTLSSLIGCTLMFNFL